MFFFLDYEGLRAITSPLYVLTLPTQNELNGIFVVPVRNPITGTVYPAGTAIPSGAINPLSAQIVAAFKNIAGLPLSGSASTGQNSADYSVLIPFRDYSDKGDLRLDYARELQPSATFCASATVRRRASTSPPFLFRSRVKLPVRSAFWTSKLRLDTRARSAPTGFWICAWVSHEPRRASRL